MGKVEEWEESGTYRVLFAAGSGIHLPVHR